MTNLIKDAHTVALKLLINDINILDFVFDDIENKK